MREHRPFRPDASFDRRVPMASLLVGFGVLAAVPAVLWMLSAPLVAGASLWGAAVVAGLVRGLAGLATRSRARREAVCVPGTDYCVAR